MVNKMLCLCFSLGLLLLWISAASRAAGAALEKAREVAQAADPLFEERWRLVEHLRAQGIRSDAVLEAMAKVPRHRFVPADQASLAYRDRPLPIGRGQTISQPFIVAYMTEAAELTSSAKVLEIGTGSGYQTAVLSQLAKEVYSVEIIPEFAESARRLLDELGYRNVQVKAGNGYEGWAEHAPFDAILVTAAPERVPQALLDQLALNGRMVIPVGTVSQEILVMTKTPSGVVKRSTIPVRFVPMTGKPKH